MTLEGDGMTLERDVCIIWETPSTNHARRWGRWGGAARAGGVRGRGRRARRCAPPLRPPPRRRTGCEHLSLSIYIRLSISLLSLSLSRSLSCSLTRPLCLSLSFSLCVSHALVLARAAAVLRLCARLIAGGQVTSPKPEITKNVIRGLGLKSSHHLVQSS